MERGLKGENEGTGLGERGAPAEVEVRGQGKAKG